MMNLPWLFTRSSSLVVSESGHVQDFFNGSHSVKRFKDAVLENGNHPLQFRFFVNDRFRWLFENDIFQVFRHRKHLEQRYAARIPGFPALLASDCLECDKLPSFEFGGYALLKRRGRFFELDRKSVV